jgi:hypothetical protein
MRGRCLSLVVILCGLVAAAPVRAQNRDTICLHEASAELCTDLALHNNAIERRLIQTRDAETQTVCRSVLAEQFGRVCAQRFREAARDQHGCYFFFKRMERSYKRQLMTHRFAQADKSGCS